MPENVTLNTKNEGNYKLLITPAWEPTINFQMPTRQWGEKLFESASTLNNSREQKQSSIYTVLFVF